MKMEEELVKQDVTRLYNEDSLLKAKYITSMYGAITQKLDKDRLKCWSSHSQMYYKIGILINFGKFSGKHLCQSTFLNKVVGWLKTSSTYYKLVQKISVREQK